MGTIKDLVDLVTQLNDSATDRKFAGELRQVQSMIASLQFEHTDIHEKRITLLEENAQLRQQVATLKEEINILKQPRKDQDHFDATEKLLDEEENVLILMTQQERITSGNVAQLLGCNGAKAEFWLSKLCDQKLISFSINLNGPTRYYLLQRGREYLVTHQHI